MSTAINYQGTTNHDVLGHLFILCMQGLTAQGMIPSDLPQTRRIGQSGLQTAATLIVVAPDLQVVVVAPDT